MGLRQSSAVIYTKWSSFIGCYAYQRIVIGPGKSRHCQTWLEQLQCLSLWNENLQQKKNWAVKSTNFKEKAAKVKWTFVIIEALWAKKLGNCVKYFRSWENILRKIVVAVNVETNWFEFWMKVKEYLRLWKFFFIFFSFSFFYFIFAEDDSQPLGISILQQTAVSFLAVPQMA